MRKVLFGIINKRLMQPWHRQARGMTLGTRTLVFDRQESEILLIQHTYAHGWMLPGGGVERGETIYQSAVREVFEEAGVVAGEEPVLLGLCSNHEAFPGDHVAILRLGKFHWPGFKPTGEIAQAKFFPVSGLPDGTTAGTRRRISEALEGRPAAAHW